MKTVTDRHKTVSPQQPELMIKKFVMFNVQVEAREQKRRVGTGKRDTLLFIVCALFFFYVTCLINTVS